MESEFISNTVLSGLLGGLIWVGLSSLFDKYRQYKNPVEIIKQGPEGKYIEIISGQPDTFFKRKCFQEVEKDINGVLMSFISRIESIEELKRAVEQYETLSVKAKDLLRVNDNLNLAEEKNRFVIAFYHGLPPKVFGPLKIKELYSNRYLLVDYIAVIPMH